MTTPTWEKVAEYEKRDPPEAATVTQEPSVFSAILKCPECGRNLNFHFNQGNHDISFQLPKSTIPASPKCSQDPLHPGWNFGAGWLLYEVTGWPASRQLYEDDFIKAMIGPFRKGDG